MKKFLVAFLFVLVPSVTFISADVGIGGNLSLGMRGADVTTLQNYLIKVGILKTNATGYFGTATMAALKQFQAQNNISAVGSAGPITRALINSKINSQNFSSQASQTNTTTSHVALPAGCTSNTGYSSATGNSCQTSASDLQAKINSMIAAVNSLKEQLMATTNTSTQSSVSDIARVRAILVDIGQGETTGNTSLIFEHMSAATAKLMQSGTTGQNVSSFTVNGVYQSGANIVASVTTTGGTPNQPPTQNMVFIKENGDWKLDMAATLQYGITTGQPTVTNNQTSNTDQPWVAVSPTSLNFTVSQGATSPASSQLLVQNYPANSSVTITKTYTTTSGGDWLSLGALTGSDIVKNLTVSPQSTGLGEGTYTASITISAIGKTLTVSVILVVTAPITQYSASNTTQYTAAPASITTFSASNTSLYSGNTTTFSFWGANVDHYTLYLACPSNVTGIHPESGNSEICNTTLQIPGNGGAIVNYDTKLSFVSGSTPVGGTGFLVSLSAYNANNLIGDGKTLNISVVNPNQ